MNALARRLRRLEQRASSHEELQHETLSNARQRLMEKIGIIHDRFEAARARGEELPTPDAEDVIATLRARLGEIKRSAHA